MNINTKNVTVANTKNDIVIRIIEFSSSAMPIVFSKKTLASYPCASDKAHNLKYEAVLDIVPKTNSIVSIN